MGDLSKNFSRYEFASGDGDPRYQTVDSELVDTLQALRDHVRRKVNITSGHRSPKHNKAVGGAAKSMHLLGIAADFWVAGYKPETLAKWLRQNVMRDFGCIIIYDNFVHIDMRRNKLDLDKREK